MGNKICERKPRWELNSAVGMFHALTGSVLTPVEKVSETLYARRVAHKENKNGRITFLPVSMRILLADLFEVSCARCARFLSANFFPTDDLRWMLHGNPSQRLSATFHSLVKSQVHENRRLSFESSILIRLADSRLSRRSLQKIVGRLTDV